MSQTATHNRAPAVQVTVKHPSKSLWAAFFLTLLFGPLGVLYSSIAGGILLTIATLVLVPLTAFLAAPLIWLASIIWGVTAAVLSKGSKSEVVK